MAGSNRRGSETVAGSYPMFIVPARSSAVRTSDLHTDVLVGDNGFGVEFVD